MARDDGVFGRSGISWTICKQSAFRSRHITTPTPHHSVLYMPDAHLVVHGTSGSTGSTSYKTIPPVRLETSGDVLSTVDMVVQRRDGPRWLCELDDDDVVEKRPLNVCVCVCVCVCMVN